LRLSFEPPLVVGLAFDGLLGFGFLTCTGLNFGNLDRAADQSERVCLLMDQIVRSSISTLPFLGPATPKPLPPDVVGVANAG
jgi:hypothetical protein